jgi:hypothetical protein
LHTTNALKREGIKPCPTVEPTPDSTAKHLYGARSVKADFDHF